MRNPLTLILPFILILLASCHDEGGDLRPADFSSPDTKKVEREKSTKENESSETRARPCQGFRSHNQVKRVASCEYVLEGRVHSSYRDELEEVSLCMLEQDVAGTKLMAFVGHLKSRNKRLKVETVYFDNALIGLEEENFDHYELERDGRVHTFSVGPQEGGRTLLYYTVKTSFFKKRLLKGAIECVLY